MAPGVRDIRAEKRTKVYNMKKLSDIKLKGVTAGSYTVPTEKRESDGTLAWDSTTMVLVRTEGGGETGLGYSYTQKSVAHLINDKLAPLVENGNVMNIPELWRTMVAGCRNYGDSSLVMMAIAAVDNSLWDLKAKILGVPLVTLFGAARRSVPIYGSGGFTSYNLQELTGQLSGWKEEGIYRMKMKIGRYPEQDPGRVRAARLAIGDQAELYVDANGGYNLKQAMAMAQILFDLGVSWFEEPVQHRDLHGLHFLRKHGPAGLEITAGEYGFNLDYFHQLLKAQTVDVLQADATRCSITVFRKVADLCQAYHLPFSSHTAPALHCHVCCSLLPVRHMEYFHDHVRIEKIFFDGLPRLERGELWPDLDRPGMGLVLKEQDVRQFAD